jgi:hypothetical protein
MNAADAASALRQRGLRVIPVPPAEKGPRLHEWKKANLSAADIRKLFRPDSNVGVILDPPLVDVDLDCVEALALAPIYLPETRAQFGRPSKPLSHWLYSSPGAVFEAFSDPLLDGKNTLVELRAQGKDGGAHQTLFPPSVTDGERREWHGDVIAPAFIEAATLRHRVAWLAVACLVFRYLSPTAARKPGPDVPDLLMEFDRPLGERAFQWLGKPYPGSAPKKYPRHRSQLTQAERDLAEIVHAIPNNGVAWDEWNSVGMAIWSVDPSEHGFIVFDDWSAKSAKYDQHETRERWRHYHRSPPNRTGIGKLIALALKEGWRPKEAAE